MENPELIKRIKSGIIQKEPEAEIYLYGSRARGDNHPNSDWDILILSPRDKITFDYESELRDPILDIELDTGEVISILVYSKSDWSAKKSISPLFTNIVKEGRKI